MCLSTAKFEDFLETFLDRIFRMINIIASEVSDSVIITDDHNDYDTVEMKLTSILTNIFQQCSMKIFQVGIKLYLKTESNYSKLCPFGIFKLNKIS